MSEAASSSAGPGECSDGELDPGEECDDGNQSDDDWCFSTCKESRCGDGVLTPFRGTLDIEECDDANQFNDDGCLDTCRLATCGDGVVQAGVEECDDGNFEDQDSCTSSCLLPRCGDGIVQLGVEECDDGDLIEGNSCTNDCTSNYALCGPLSGPLVGAEPVPGFASSIVLAGDLVVIGSPSSDGADVASGAVFVCTPRGTEWEQIATLAAADGLEGDGFGASVDLDGDTIVVGAPKAESGAVYVFRGDAVNGWTQDSKLVDGEASDDERFGAALALVGDALVVGAPKKDNPAARGGAACIFTREDLDSPYQQVKQLTPPESSKDALFGASVGFDGEAIALGAPGENIEGDTARGAVYVFDRGGGASWSSAELAKRIVDPSGASYDDFGTSVVIRDDVLLVGAPGVKTGPDTYNRGAVVVSTRLAGETWGSATLVARLFDTESGDGDGFGASVALAGSIIAVGSPSSNSAGQDRGAVVIFAGGDEEGWAGASATARLIADGVMDGHRLGEALAFDGTLLAASGHYEAGAVGKFRGVLHLFAAELWSP